MARVKDVSGIPMQGKDLVIVAAVDDVLHFRMFDGVGTVVVDTDEKRMTEQAQQIEELRKQLGGLWHLHELTVRDKSRVITAVTSIVAHARLNTPANDSIQLTSLDDDRLGWVLADQVVPADQAIAYFTEQIAKEPRDVGTYWMRRQRLGSNERIETERKPISIGRSRSSQSEPVFT